MIGHFLRELAEKIDRVRLLAGSLLQRFFDHLSSEFSIVNQKELYNIFCQKNIRDLVLKNQKAVDSAL